jgi:hypothetical protein
VGRITAATAAPTTAALHRNTDEMSTKPPLTQERLQERLRYDEKSGAFTWRVDRGHKARVGAQAGSRHSKGYLRIAIDGRHHFSHRLAWLYVHAMWPVADLDHKDEDKANNKIANLRECVGDIDNQQNKKNPQRNNTSGVRGVTWSKKSNRWMAYIQVKKRMLHLGGFVSIEEATEARLAGVMKFHPAARDVLTECLVRHQPAA